MAELPLLPLILLSLAVGVLIGAMFMRFWSPRLKSSKDLQEKLKQSEQELDNYREDVTKHFTDTSRLVNNLSQSYRDVHEHLANSAMKLTTPTISRKFMHQLDQPTSVEPSLEDNLAEERDTHIASDDPKNVAENPHHT